MTAYFRFALVAMLLLGIACVSAIVTMQFAVHGTVVTVPDFKGQPVETAVRQAAALGLDMSVTQRFYSTVLPAGRVLQQSSQPGAQVRRGWNLAVAESLGPQQIAIPDVTGKNEHDAILAIRQKGLEPGVLAHMPDAQFPAGTVLAQDPGPHATGAERPTISLLIADPEPAESPEFAMPDETGKLYSQVAAEFEKAGLHAESMPAAPVGSQVALTTETRPGIVIAQTPATGKKVDAATRIVLFVTVPAKPDSQP